MYVLIYIEKIKFWMARKLLLQALMADKLAGCSILRKVKNTFLSVLNSPSFHHFCETRILCLCLLVSCPLKVLRGLIKANQFQH